MAQKTNAFSFRFSEENLNEQVRNYSSLEITKSARGQCVLFFATLNIFTLLLTYFIDISGITFRDVILEILIIFVPLLIFVYKGHRWAIIGIMAVWTIEKIYTFYLLATNGGSPLMSIFYLILGLGVCARALQVENAHRKTLIA
jgi:uncharacterized membrane protein